MGFGPVALRATDDLLLTHNSQNENETHMKATVATITLLSFCAGSAMAGIPLDHEASFNAFGVEMPFGDGNLNTNYSILRTSDSFGNIELGLKAKERYVGDLTTNGSGRYFANAGSPNNDGLASWNIDFGFALPQDALPTNYNLSLFVDFDPGFGQTSFVELNLTNFFAANSIASPTGGDSQNLGFGFWGVDIPTIIDATGYAAFDPDASGEYSVSLVLSDSIAEIGRSSIVVEVVPAPAGAALLGLGGLAAVRRRRA